jgi:hypothetical protein
MGTVSQKTTLTRFDVKAAQFKVVETPVREGIRHNPLKWGSVHGNRASASGAGSGPRSWSANPVAALECLSFVMPQQQGAAVAECEDGK